MLKFRQLKQEERVKGDYRPFARRNIRTSKLKEKFGIIFENPVKLGLGTTKVASFITENGTRFYLQEHTSNEVISAYIGCLNNPKTIAIELDEVLEVLELDSTFITYLEEGIKLIPYEL